MCQLLLGVSNTPKNTTFIKSITTQFDDMRSQKDGIGAFVITFDGKLEVFRDLNDYDSVFHDIKLLLPQARAVGVHTRISTGGGITDENVHFFESGGCLLAHNGIVGKFSSFGRGGNWGRGTLLDAPARVTTTTTEQELQDETLACNGCLTSLRGLCKIHARKLHLFKEAKEEVDNYFGEEPDEAPAAKNPCDSLQFLQAIPKPLTADGIADYIKETNMNGMMVMYDKKTNKLFIAVKKEAYAITDKKTFSTFYSFKPETEVKKDTWDWMFGVAIYRKEIKEKLGFLPRKLSYGTFEVEF